MADIKLSWVQGLEFTVHTATGATLVTKSPKDEGPPGISPMQLLLVALAGCTAMDVVALLRKMRNELESTEVEVEAAKAPEHPKVYTDIRLHFTVKGKVRKKDLERAMELSRTKYCSVGAMLEKTARITYTYELLGGDSK